MQVRNTTENPVTIAGVHIIAAKSAREFDDAQWAELRARPAVADWLARGVLVEGFAEPQVTHIADSFTVATADEPAAPRHPLDHDGDGKPGGSLPKAARKSRGK